MKDPVYKVKLKKISDSPSFLTSEEMQGTTLNLPKAGLAFIFFRDNSEDSSVYTTPVQHVEQIGNSYRFNTRNSIYHLEVIGEESVQ